LQAQIQALEAEISASKESLNALQSSQPDAAAEAALAAAVEHEALLKAQENFSAIEAEIQQLKAAHTQALEDAHAKIEAAEGKAGLVEGLDAQLVGLRAEKEDAVTKLSEIEVEVLELKESHETAEDDLAKAAASISSLEQQLAQALAATQQAIDDATAKETEYTSKADEAKAVHDSELKAASEAHAQTVSQLEALKTELEAALASHEETKAAAHAAVEEHTRLLGEAEEGYLKKQSELSDEVRRITMELEVADSFNCVQMEANFYLGPRSPIQCESRCRQG
jgi:chromosome segregation ATPase